MWGTIRNLASSAVEQTLNIANDVGEVTKQGFDLLEKLDNSLGEEEEEKAAAVKNHETYDSAVANLEKATASIEQSEITVEDERTSTDRWGRASAESRSRDELLAVENSVLVQEVKHRLGCSELAGADSVLAALQLVIDEADVKSEKSIASHKDVIEYNETETVTGATVLKPLLSSIQQNVDVEAESLRLAFKKLESKFSQSSCQYEEELSKLSRQRERDSHVIESLQQEKETILAEQLALGELYQQSQVSLNSALAQIDSMMSERIDLNAKIESITMQLVEGESRRHAMEVSKQAIRDMERKCESLQGDLQAVRSRTTQLEKLLRESTHTGEVSKTEIQTLKSKIIVASEQEIALQKKHNDELFEIQEQLRLQCETSRELKEENEKLIKQKAEREQVYNRTVMSLDEALGQIHELSISSHRKEPANLEDHISNASQIPETPSGKGDLRDMSISMDCTPQTPDTPDLSSFKTPGGPPGTTSGRKNSKNKKNKTEIAKEIKILNSQLKDVREIQVLR